MHGENGWYYQPSQSDDHGKLYPVIEGVISFWGDTLIALEKISGAAIQLYAWAFPQNVSSTATRIRISLL